MIGSDLEGADPESRRVASWAASAVMQPQLEAVVGSQQLTAT